MIDNAIYDRACGRFFFRRREGHGMIPQTKIQYLQAIKAAEDMPDFFIENYIDWLKQFSDYE